MIMLNLLEKLKTDAWRTSSARYNAARRLRRRENFATISLTLMSSFTVALAFLQRIYAPGTPADNYLGFISAALGVFLLTISLVQWGSRAGVIAEELHHNAEKLNGFNRRVSIECAAKNSENITVDDITRLNQEYESIKDECKQNHIPLDDLFFKVHHLNAPEFLNGKSGPAISPRAVMFIKIRWYLSSLWFIPFIWISLILIMIPLASPDMWISTSYHNESTSITKSIQSHKQE